MSGEGALRNVPDGFILRSDHKRLLGDAQLRGDLRASERYKSGFANGAALVVYAAVIVLTFVALGAFNLGLNLGTCQ